MAASASSDSAAGPHSLTNGVDTRWLPDSTLLTRNSGSIPQSFPASLRAKM